MARLAALLVLCLATGPARSAEVVPEEAGELLTLDQAIALALKENRQLSNSKLTVAGWGDQTASTRAQLLPQFNLRVIPSYSILPLNLTFPAGAFGTYRVIGEFPPTSTTVPTGSGYTTIAEAGVTQPLTGLYKGFVALDQLGVSASMSKEDLRNQKETTVNNVRQAYLAVLQTETSIVDLREQVAWWQETLKVVTQQVGEQVVTSPALLQAQASLLQAEYNLKAAVHTLADRKEQLNYQLGRDVATPFHTSPMAMEPPAEVSLETARESALKQRPDLQKAKLNIEYNRYNVSLKAADFIPTINLTFNYISPITSNVLPKNILYVGIDFQWDVFDWGRKLHDLDYLNKVLAQSQTAAKDAEAQVLLNVNSTYRALEDARDFLKVADLNQKAARAQLKVVQDAYRQQTALLKDLLGAQASVSAASDQYRQAELNLWSAESNFEKAVGTAE